VTVAWGIVVVVLSVLAWGGQTISWFSPPTAERLSLTEAEADVDPAFYADIRGEALWDTLTLWVLIVAGALRIAGNATWPYWGLGGGAIYVYFAGRGLLTRRAMKQRGLRIGSAQNLKSAYLFLTVWGVMGLATLIAASVELAS
jgi:hypothetical protein